MPRFDKHTTGEEVAKIFADQIKGKTVILTGPNQGIGLETARLLAVYGAKVVLAGRNLSKLKEAAKIIKKDAPDAVLKELVIDLSSLKSVRQAAEEVLKYSGPIDVVITNAGVMGTPYEKTVDGFELQLAANHLGHFVFINLIVPKLLESPAPRVVLASSSAHHFGPVRFDDYSFQDGKTYDKWFAYGQSKTAINLFGVEFAERYKNKIVVFSLHPGGTTTNLHSHMTQEDYTRFSGFYHPDGTPKGDWPQTVQECTTSYFVAAFDPSIANESGAYLVDGNLAPEQVAPYSVDKENAKKLWALSEELVGAKF
ncbi:NAD-P-binding protein [Mycena pura]|uniref:NAD-P-binding protein n=1 Tax=Mycena pura TaxID=153505 RepID=A0AAD6YJ89_9AGAR|nr:NAD-P-binding protein [Mycena pura]